MSRSREGSPRNVIVQSLVFVAFAALVLPRAIGQGGIFRLVAFALVLVAAWRLVQAIEQLVRGRSEPAQVSAGQQWPTAPGLQYPAAPGQQWPTQGQQWPAQGQQWPAPGQAWQGSGTPDAPEPSSGPTSG